MSLAISVKVLLTHKFLNSQYVLCFQPVECSLFFSTNAFSFCKDNNKSCFVNLKFCYYHYSHFEILKLFMNFVC